MRTEIDQLLAELKAGLSDIYGPRLRGVYLYGSQVRSVADQESDVDILIVLDEFDSFGREVDRTGQLVSNVSLKYDLSVSRVFVREADWRQQVTSFLTSVRAEAVPV